MNAPESTLITRLKIADRLPTPKGVALEVINLSQQENVSTQDIVRLIGTDPALSARVIQAAYALRSNSSMPLATITDAVTVLGVRALRQLVLSIAMISNYRKGPCRQFNYLNFWAHSLLTGIAAKHLAARARLYAAEEFFVLGLLANIGQLAMVTVYPEAYGELLERAKEMPLEALRNLERCQFGCDQVELSVAMLADMHFPEIFQALAQDFRQPACSTMVEGTRDWRLLQLLQVASMVAEACLSTTVARDALVNKLKLHAGRIDIGFEQLVEIGDACIRDWLDWLALLNMGKVHVPPFAELLKQPEAQLLEVPQWARGSLSMQRLCVLVVEDDRVTLECLQAMLIAAGHEVLAARDNLEAMQVVAQKQPQLVITGWKIPKLEGIALCSELRRSLREVYLLILATQENVDRLNEVFEAGVDDYLLKPVSQNLFFARLRAAGRVVRLQQELAFDREQLLRFSTDLAASNERLQELALTDMLTELPNRRCAMERLEQEWALAVRGSRTLSCMMVDIDHFKPINDKFGHQVGDEALKYVAKLLRQSARGQDVLCRYGGEEFVVICPDTGIKAACQCAERLRGNIAAELFKHQGGELRLTISIGVVEKNEATTCVEDLLAFADERMYAAKRAGRNRIAC